MVTYVREFHLHRDATRLILYTRLFLHPILYGGGGEEGGYLPPM